MKTLTILASVLILSACSSMSPAEKAVADLAKSSRQIEKEHEKMKSTVKTQEATIKDLKKQNRELEEANKVLRRYIDEMKK